MNDFIYKTWFIYKMLYDQDGKKKTETKNKSPFSCAPIPLLRYGGRLLSGILERQKQVGGGVDLMGNKKKRWGQVEWIYADEIPRYSF